ncbi:MAG: hypothetical protein ACRDZX_08865 [Acidimicrobiales bacterium]
MVVAAAVVVVAAAVVVVVGTERAGAERVVDVVEVLVVTAGSVVVVIVVVVLAVGVRVVVGAKGTVGPSPVGLDTGVVCRAVVGGDVFEVLDLFGGEVDAVVTAELELVGAVTGGEVTVVDVSRSSSGVVPVPTDEVGAVGAVVTLGVLDVVEPSVVVGPAAAATSSWVTSASSDLIWRCSETISWASRRTLAERGLGVEVVEEVGPVTARAAGAAVEVVEAGEAGELLA